MEYPKICQVEAISDRILRVTFTNQTIKDYDISPLLEKPIFALLRQPTFFKSFTLEPGGYGIVWNEDIDISEYELWRHSTALKADGDLNPTGIAPEHSAQQSTHKC
ncbi:DUF2442 domain-containing protein [Nodosilinea sp. LEGE 06152]|uniref:DUF2442 domain-containing protein n=1 Tax=Nodosilinea sp. LEGE 06152 TaxID=2777966 RepID=UPI00187E7EEB|nr:DUF2442 domain-containing protein [Nodosilinea sp. LEGE 06152]MBE9156149.1 DUF2442 domain-containing protein [Nodosilinea sp. LEGE 06152]